MAKRPQKQTISTPSPGKRRVTAKKDAIKLTDTIWTTGKGQTYTRRQLSNKLSRANYKLRQAQNYMTDRGYRNLVQDFADVVDTAYRAAGRQIYGTEGDLPLRFTDQGLFSLRGITDPKALRIISDAADRILSWERMNKTGYKTLRANAIVAQQQHFKRYDPQTGQFHTFLTDEQAEALVDLYESDDWADFSAGIKGSSGTVMDMLVDMYADDAARIADIVDEMLKYHKAAVEDPDVFDPFDAPADWLDAYLSGELKDLNIDEETEL